ncbi:hypothetical protein NP493_881g01026 [Ridgeia piscesae]|uniref:Uncharacterized protein n=1 Tax=Ridgeia piscesae TaxID=27915 RepID=A0AAD9KMF0_RIDPI|nr:hypothetical protein NP493_881g01026 [Ridgeia piscesae]
MSTVYRAAIECPDIFIHTMVWIYHSEGKAQLEQSCKNCFQNNRQRPPQF